MRVYVLLAYDEDYYTYESYLGVFRTREEAINFIENDYWDGTREHKHKQYKIKEEPI